MYLKMSEAKIIIIGGKSRSGKDTIAGFIKNHYEKENKKVIILQYSHYIKEYAKTISDWDGSELDKPRRLLQVLGTDIIRNNIDVDFFTKRTIEDINNTYIFYYNKVSTHIFFSKILYFFYLFFYLKFPYQLFF